MIVFKRITGWLAFIAGLAVLLLAASCIVVPKDNTWQAGMEQSRANGILGEPSDTIDVLFLGDSEAHTMISPLLLWKQTGIPAYTCGTDSQKLTYSLTMLERALENQKPKLVILETLAIYRTITPGDVVTSELSHGFPVFQHHDRWKSLTLQDFTMKTAATGRSAYKGHHPNQNIVPAENKEYMQPTKNVAEIAKTNQIYVREIQKRCQRSGAKLLLVSSPSPINWNYSRHNGIQALADELGCEYIDLNLQNEKLKIDWTQDTYDKGDHLNHFGAVKVTEYLGAYLQKTGLFQDRRQDDAFQEWNRQLAEYEAALQN